MIHDTAKAEGIAVGNAKLIHIIRIKDAKNLSAIDIADLLELDLNYVKQVIQLSHDIPDADDIKIAELLQSSDLQHPMLSMIRN